MPCSCSWTTVPTPYRRLRPPPRSGGSRPIGNRPCSRLSSGRSSRLLQLPRAELWPNSARKACRRATGWRRTSCPFHPCGLAGSLCTARTMTGRCRRERSASRWMRLPHSVPASIRRPAAVSWLSSAWRADRDFTDCSISGPEPGFSRSPQRSCCTALCWPAISIGGRSALPAATLCATPSPGWCNTALRRVTVIGSSANHATIWSCPIS